MDGSGCANASVVSISLIYNSFNFFGFSANNDTQYRVVSSFFRAPVSFSTIGVLSTGASGVDVFTVLAVGSWSIEFGSSKTLNASFFLITSIDGAGCGGDAAASAV